MRFVIYRSSLLTVEYCVLDGDLWVRRDKNSLTLMKTTPSMKFGGREGDFVIGDVLEIVEGLWPGQRDGTTPLNVLRRHEEWQTVSEVMES